MLPYCCRARRKFQRGLKRKPMTLIKKLRKAKKECEEGEKPNTVRTHLRNMTIVPEMIGSIVGVYNGKTFNQVSLLAAVLWGTGAGALGKCHFLGSTSQSAVHWFSSQGLMHDHVCSHGGACSPSCTLSMTGINLHHVSSPAAQLGNGSMHDGTSRRYIQQPQCLYKASVLM